TYGYKEWLNDISQIVKPSTTALKSQSASDGDFVSMFDGKTLNGWRKAVENPQSFKVENGTIVASGPRCHLFYEGDGKPFKNFHFLCEAMTRAKSNGGIYFHTRIQ